MGLSSLPFSRGLAFSSLWALLSFIYSAQAWIDYSDNGYATMTHYELPLNFIASCGCTVNSTQYPTAAMSEQAFGSASAYGPACGRCFNLTLLNTFLSDPPFYPNQTKSVVVKITDSCPSISVWCSATSSKPNPGGHLLNFDLAWPSTSIPDDFFPSDVALYGYTDFGVWNISYESVACDGNWEGFSNPAALGSVADFGTSVCCPEDPFSNPNETCPSFSDKNGIPPNTGSAALGDPLSLRLVGIVQLIVLIAYYIQ